MPRGIFKWWIVCTSYRTQYESLDKIIWFQKTKEIQRENGRIGQNHGRSIWLKLFLKKWGIFRENQEAYTKPATGKCLFFDVITHLDCFESGWQSCLCSHTSVQLSHWLPRLVRMWPNFCWSLEDPRNVLSGLFLGMSNCLEWTSILRSPMYLL